MSALAELPWWYWSGVAIAFGAVWGSFLNVVIFRVPRGVSVVSPPSACPGCKQPIAWYDNVPVLSWIALGAKCRRCKTPIAARYPLVELLGALLSLALMYKFGPSASYVVYFVFVMALVAIAFIDLDTWLIPDVISLPGIVLGIAGAFALPDMPWRDHIIGAVAGGGVLWAVSALAKAVMKKDGMGFGDVKLLAMIGAFLGWQSLVFTVGLGSFQGALIGGVWLFVNRNAPPPPPQKDGFVPPKGAVPFGPFLALGAIEYLFFGEQLLHLVHAP